MPDRDLFQIQPGGAWYLGGERVEPRTVRIGSECYVCLRCASLVEASPSGAHAHGQWHERIEAVLASVEHADALAAELRERGDG